MRNTSGLPKKGDKKVDGSGRKKGSKNKRPALHDICDAVGINVFEEMVRIANETEAPGERFDRLKDIAPYLYPKQKEMTLTLEHFSIDQIKEFLLSKKADESD